MAGLIVALLLALTPAAAHADPVSITVFLASNVGAWAASAFVFVWNYATYVIAFGTMYASSQSQKRKAERAARDALRDRTVMVRSSEAPQNVVYGRARVSGPIAYAVTSGQDKEFLHLVVVLAGHEIDAIEEVWLNDEPLGTLDANGWVQDGTYAKVRTQTDTQGFTVPSNRVLTLSKTPASILSVAIVSGDGFSYFATPYTSSGATVTLTDTSTVGWQCLVTYTWNDASNSFVRVKRFLGVAAGSRDTDLETASDGAWTSNHLGKNVARVHLTLKYDQDVFPSGIPNVSAVVRGKKVLDPRTGVTAWSSNPALCVRDYLTSGAGFGAGSAEIDATAVATAANICDELVNYDATNTHARYSCDGAFTLDASRREILEDLLGSMVGTAVFSGGKWVIRAGAYVTPTLDLDDGDLADGSVQVQARTGRRELFNAVRGQFVDPTQKYAVVDFPPYASSTFAAEDGGETVHQDIQLPFTADTYRAQRIAKLVLFRARQALIMAATWKLPAYALQPSDTVRLTVARYGWTNKVFRVVEREYVHPHQVKLTLQEEASAVYAWNFSEAVAPDPAPNTDLPDPRSVAAITGLTVSSGAAEFRRLSDGSVTPLARVAWDTVGNVSVLDGGAIELKWKRAFETTWNLIELPGDSSEYSLATSAGEIVNVAVRAKNGALVRGEWAFVTHTVSADAPATSASATGGSGANLLRNAGMRYSVIPWARFNGSSGQTSTYTPVPLAAGDDHAPAPYGAVKYFGSGPTYSIGAGAPTVYQDESGWVAVSGGRRYEVQVRAKTYEARMTLQVAWFDSAGGQIGAASTVQAGRASSENRSAASYATLTDIDSFDHLWGFVTAPTGATRASVVLGLERPASDKGDSIFVFALPFFQQAGPAQVQPSSWSEGEGPVTTELMAAGSATEVIEVARDIPLALAANATQSVQAISIPNPNAEAMECILTTTVDYDFDGNSSANSIDVRGFFYDYAEINPSWVHQGPILAGGARQSGVFTFSRRVALRAFTTEQFDVRLEIVGGVNWVNLVSRARVRAEVIKR
ncbi:phage tail protein [Thiohalocapsa marina]|uniref:phage tail protein n=1 Tax=Thiohalocapsa marina TaxID=424902 RepID=UPI0036D8379C